MLAAHQSVAPSAIASRQPQRSRAALDTSSSRKMASGAAATRLKWPMLRVTSTGLQAKAIPATHASAVRPVTRRASRKVAKAVSTRVSSITTLNVATTPKLRTSGSASRF